MLEEKTKSLRPMRLSEILDNTFGIYGRNIAAILLISLLIGGVFSVVTSFVINTDTDEFIVSMEDYQEQLEEFIEGAEEDPNSVSPEILLDILKDIFEPMFKMIGYSMLFSLIAQFLIMPFVQGGIINITYKDMEGDRQDVSGAYESAFKKLGKMLLTKICMLIYYIGICLVITILVVSLGILISLLVATTTGARAGLAILLLILGFMVLIVLSFLSFFFVSFVYQSTVVDGIYGFSAISRSFKFIRKNFWRVLGISLLANLIAFTFGIIILLFAGALSFLSSGNILNVILTSVGKYALTFPFLHIIRTVVYLDVRARVEGQVEIEDLAYNL